ncbi:RNA polymerase sigma factor SigJ [Sphingomonas flavalba]|uniref:RNA polymerase sigma factor SigJ n=1 Tax=Sphingomonas flavalba TaxID=2559804 RepID=UPI00109E148E|nr:RNA polymerase sigma factor SigJ [Sphingomonas flavalba]
MNARDAELFEQARPRLLGLAYRMLGSRADAEDAVQDCFLKWSRADRAPIVEPAAWLTTVCTRRCLDLLRAARRRRVDYVGSWLPEPLHAATPDDGEAAGLASTLTTAFLLMLERLSPKERAAYLLREIFDQPYPAIAATLAIDEAACRKLVSRARAHVDAGKARHHTPAETQDRLLDAFHAAILSGSPEPLAELLSADIRLTADGGGKASAILGVLEGQYRVLGFIRHAHKWWDGFDWTAADINGARGAILRRDGAPVLTLTFAYDAAGRIAHIFIMRNPDKLGRLGPARIR